MAGKYKRSTIGSVVKSKEADRPNYIKFNLKYYEGAPIIIKDGMTLSVESKKFQQEGLERAFTDGKISEENFTKAKARITNIPDFVLGELVLVEKS